MLELVSLCSQSFLVHSQSTILVPGHVMGACMLMNLRKFRAPTPQVLRLETTPNLKFGEHHPETAGPIEKRSFANPSKGLRSKENRNFRV